MENIFIKACQNNDKAITRLLMDKGGLDFNTQDELGNTGLHYLCMNDDPVLAEKLINAGAKVNIENSHMETPLHLAAARGSILLIKLLLAKKADINAQDRFGITPLIAAIRNKQVPAAEFFILLDADKFMRTKNNLTAAEYSKAEGLTELQHYFRDEPPSSDINGNTPLHHAVNQNDPGIVKSILDKDKSGIDIQNKRGQTPLLISINKLNYGISDLLLQAGANPNVFNIENENTPLHIAAMNGVTWLGEILLEYGANVNAINRDGSTPLILAVLGQHREFISLLLAKNAVREVKDHNGKTALDYALEWDTSDIIDLLDTGKSKLFQKNRPK